MRELINNCISELDANRAYYLTLPLFLLLTAGDRLDTSPTDKLVTAVEQVTGLVLFVFVVVPLGLFGEMLRKGKRHAASENNR